MGVGRVCTREVDDIGPEETVLAAAIRMHQRNVGTLMVVDSEGMPVGVVTDRDLVTRVMAARRDPSETAVKEIMTRPVRTVEFETPVTEALECMREGAVRRLGVTGPDGRILGVVSLDDILRRLAAEFTAISQLLAREGPRAIGPTQF